MEISNMFIIDYNDMIADTNYFKDNVIAQLDDDEFVSNVKLLENSLNYILITVSKKSIGVNDYDNIKPSADNDLPQKNYPEMSTFKQRAYFKKLLKEHGTPNSYTEEQLRNMTKLEIGQKIKMLKNN